MSQPTSADIFEGTPQGKIWLDSVKCDPSQKETSGNTERAYLFVITNAAAFALKDCNHSEWGGSGVCDHSHDVGVVCAGKYNDLNS